MLPDAPKNKLRAPLRPLDGPTLALTTFGLGFLRPAPGTWGSLPPPIIAALLVLLGAGSAWHYATMGLLFLAFAFACVAFGRYAETRFGRKDAAEVVADESSAVALALAALHPDLVSAEAEWPALTFIALTFIAFRIFDITKPWPARRLENLPHGWGVLVDDLVAAIYAAITVQLTFLILVPTLSSP